MPSHGRSSRNLTVFGSRICFADLEAPLICGAHINMIEHLVSAIVSEASVLNSYDAFKYSSHFQHLARSAYSEKNSDLRNIYVTLAGVCGFLFQPEQTYPFGPMVEMRGKRSMVPDDLSDKQLDELEELTAENLPPAMMALFCDVLWIRRKDHVRAREAIAAYLMCARNGYVEHWPTASDCAHRAAKIAAELGRNADERETVRNELITMFDEAAASPSNDEKRFWPYALAKVLICECRDVDYLKISNTCCVLGSAMRDVDTKDKYFRVSADAITRANLPNERREIYRLIGQTWEDSANELRAVENPNGMLIADRLKKAVDAYREAGERDRAEQLVKELQQANKLTIGQMKTFTVRKDVTKYFQMVEKAMADKSGNDIVNAFVRLHKPASYTEAYKTAMAEIERPRLQKFIPCTTLVQEGNIVSRTSGDPAANDVAVVKELVDIYVSIHPVLGPLLDHARAIILEDAARAWVPAIEQIINQSVFVAEERRDIWHRAITAGIDGDLLLFTHLVIPQVEHSVRILVSKLGGKTTALRSGLMNERDLNTLLVEKDEGKDAYTALGDDITWELRALLVEKAGPNLRNRVCHGLATTRECTGATAVYLLWLTLYILTGDTGPGKP